jgi:hypothetical protein
MCQRAKLNKRVGEGGHEGTSTDGTRRAGSRLTVFLNLDNGLSHGTPDHGDGVPDYDGVNSTVERLTSTGSHVLAQLQLREEKWHYEGGRRDLRLDLMRGFAAVAMIADHIGGSGSLLYPITGGNRFFVSAAEAFVFISGVVMGIVYLNVFVKQGLGPMLMKAFNRAWALYLITVFVTLTFAAAGKLLNLWWAPDLSGGGAPRFVLDVITLHRTIFLADIMLM